MVIIAGLLCPNLASARRVREEVIFPTDRELDRRELEEILKYLTPKVKGIVLDCLGTLMRFRDLKIEDNMVALLVSIMNKGIPIAILTDLPFWSLKLTVLQYFPKDFAERIFIGHKKDIINFMQIKGLNSEDLMLILDDPVGRDRLLIELAADAWGINVGEFFANLSKKILTSKTKGPAGTEIVLGIIDNYIGNEFK